LYVITVPELPHYLLDNVLVQLDNINQVVDVVHVEQIVQHVQMPILVHHVIVVLQPHLVQTHVINNVLQPSIKVDCHVNLVQKIVQQTVLQVQLVTQVIVHQDIVIKNRRILANQIILFYCQY